MYCFLMCIQYGRDGTFDYLMNLEKTVGIYRAFNDLPLTIH